MILSTESYTIRMRAGDLGTVDLLKEAGFTGIDYTIAKMKDWDEIVGAPGYIEYADELRKYTEDRGLRYSQSHAPYDFKYGMKMSIETPEYARIVRSMEFAAHLGAPMIVLHCVRLPGDSMEEHFEYNLKYYRSFLPYAEKYGIKIAVENLGGRAPGTEIYTQLCLGNAKMFRSMMEELNSPMYCGCIDIGHANVTTGDAPGFIRSCKGYVQYLHVHDNDGTSDMHRLPAISGAGLRGFTVPWDEVLTALKEIGYDGPLDLEIYRFADCFRNEELPLALKLAATVGNAMIEKLV